MKKKKKIDKSMAFSVWLTFHIFIIIIIGLFIPCFVHTRRKKRMHTCVHFVSVHAKKGNKYTYKNTHIIILGT